MLWVNWEINSWHRVNPLGAGLRDTSWFISAPTDVMPGTSLATELRRHAFKEMYMAFGDF